MPRVEFAPALQRHVSCPPVEAAGSTVREVLDAAFADNALARSYVLDDQAALRKHLAIFINGDRIRDRVHLSDPVPQNGVIYVIQALSGG
jgi:molybdopterin synthase sulfur carrier subunit